MIIHLVVDAPLEGHLEGRLGQRLIDWSRLPLSRVIARHRGTQTSLFHAVPPDPALIGLPFYSQAHVTGRGGAKLTNALDGEFVRSSRSSLERGRTASPRGH